MSAKSLFHGIAVIIDDQIGDAAAEITKIQVEIEAAGSYVVSMPKIPANERVENLRASSFFIVDWNLDPTVSVTEGGEVETTRLPSELRKQKVADMIDFLKTLRKTKFAPIFIFTNESVEGVNKHIDKHKELREPGDSSCIFVKSKSDVITKGVFKVLDEFLDAVPSAYVLKHWEREYERAKNQLFLDFYEKSGLWPLLLWKTFSEDGVSPSLELGKLISRNLFSRMTPFDFDLSSMMKELPSTDSEQYRKMLLQVLEGERFLPNERLHASSIEPGDVFKVKDKFYINIRPDCDCIPRDGKAIELFLLEGQCMTKANVNRQYDANRGLIREGENESVVFGLVKGATVSFRFKELRISPWDDWKDRRIGRLLPPFLTRLQQRYANYLQRPGLTRIPRAAIEGILIDPCADPFDPVAGAFLNTLKPDSRWGKPAS